MSTISEQDGASGLGLWGSHPAEAGVESGQGPQMRGAGWWPSRRHDAAQGGRRVCVQGRLLEKGFPP